MTRPPDGNVADFDVIIVGSGAAGLAAAYEAAGAAARTIVVESEGRAGGSSRLSGCWILAAGTEHQRRAGHDDSPDAMLHDHLATNRWRVEPSLARVFCEAAPDIVTWLESLGIEFGPLVQAGAERVPRGHRAIGEGEALITALDRACRERGVEFAFGNRVESLVVEGQRVTGVRARGETLTAAAVVVAAGGFARNRALLDRYAPSPWAGAPGAQPESVSAPGCRGDGLAMLRDAGARIVGEGRALWVPQAITPAAVLLTDTQGHRFISEATDFLAVSYAAQGEYLAIFDERIRRDAPRLPSIDRTAAGFLFRDADPALAGEPLASWRRNGDLVRAPTIGGIATAFGIAPATLESTVERYNDACARRHDERFEKPPDSLWPLTASPFWGVRVRPTVIVATFCGAQIDTRSRVLDHTERPILGLYAAGESAGGIVGDVYDGHGISVTSSLVFGRIAGRNAAELRL